MDRVELCSLRERNSARFLKQAVPRASASKHKPTNDDEEHTGSWCMLLLRKQPHTFALCFIRRSRTNFSDVAANMSCTSRNAMLLTFLFDR